MIGNNNNIMILDMIGRQLVDSELVQKQDLVSGSLVLLLLKQFLACVARMWLVEVLFSP